MKHCKRLSFKQILTIIFIAFLFYSCKSTKDLPYVPLPVENVIHESFKNDNVRELIGHYLEYPEYRNQLSGYLIYDRTYENESYKKLLEYKQLTKNDVFLNEAYDNLIKQREYEILTYLSKCSLDEIAEYYQFHDDQKCFLKPAIESTLLADIKNYDYNSLRKLHNSFIQTDLIEQIDIVYLQAQKKIHNELKKQLPNYFKKEAEIINVYQERTLYEIEQYLSNPIETIVDQMLEDNLPEEESKINQLFIHVYNNNVYNYQITEIINNNIQECFELINGNRTYYLNTLMEGEKFSGYKIEKKHINVNFVINNPAHHLYELSKIQNKTDWTGWGLSAASLAANVLSFGTLGNLIDVADIARSAKNTKEGMDLSKKYIKKFIDALANELKQATQNSVNIIFNSIKSDFKQSQNNFKTVIYENY